MGKGRTPGDSKVSARDNRHQAHRTSASVGTTSRVSRACQTKKRSWLWVPAVSTKSLSRVLAPLGGVVTTLHCHLMDTRQGKYRSPSDNEIQISYPFPRIRARAMPQPREVRNDNGTGWWTLQSWKEKRNLHIWC